MWLLECSGWLLGVFSSFIIRLVKILKPNHKKVSNKLHSILFYLI